MTVLSPIINTIGFLPTHLIIISVALFLLIKSADAFIDGASGIANYFSIPPLIIGIFIVGVGTSLPELIVSAMAAMDGKSALSLGNVLGSNIANISLIIGLTAVLSPIIVCRKLLKKEFIIMTFAALMAGITIYDGHFSRYDGFFIIVVFLISMYALIKGDNNQEADVTINKEEINILKSSLFTVGGLGLLLFSSNQLVNSASQIAMHFGASELIVGLTIVAVGTSLPELAASIAAARKKQAELTIGNILGSNIFNILAVLPIAGLIKPYDVENVAITRDLPLMIILTVLFFIMSYSFKKNEDGTISRYKGFILLSVFIAYQGYLILNVMNIL